MTSDALERTSIDRKTKFIEHVALQMETAATTGQYAVVVESHMFVDMSELEDCIAEIEATGYTVTPRSRCGDVIKISWRK